MAEFDNTNRGVAFKNDTKGNEKSPIWKGKGNYNGTDFEFSIWEKTSQNGKNFLSFSFSKPYVKNDTDKRYPNGKEKNDMPSMSDPSDLPF